MLEFMYLTELIRLWWRKLLTNYQWVVVAIIYIAGTVFLIWMLKDIST